MNPVNRLKSFQCARPRDVNHHMDLLDPDLSTLDRAAEDALILALTQRRLREVGLIDRLSAVRAFRGAEAGNPFGAEPGEFLEDYGLPFALAGHILSATLSVKGARPGSQLQEQDHGDRASVGRL
jgi:hypothetical protein